MKTTKLLFFVALLAAAPANAQTTSATPAAPATPAPGTVVTPAPSADTPAPMPGANSFTEAQARARIEQAGFTAVTGLVKDKDGIWRANATKNGQSVAVALDFKGNVTVK